MKKSYFLSGLIGIMLGVVGMPVVSNGATTDEIEARAASSLVTNSTNGLRGLNAHAQAYRINQRNLYYMVTQPDVESSCRERIMACLNDYCGDMTIIPGQNTGGRCAYATESELYNAALLCLQKDTSVLLPQYTSSVYSNKGGVNTAASLCPKYVQQELMSYLAMANMATQLSKSHSELCVQRRQELGAAMSCHSVALAYGNETASKLNTYLNDYCGSGVPGGSAEMVTRFATAGNVGANVWGWAEKIVSLDLNQKGEDWQVAVDAVLAGYTNRMNLACGENLQINTSSPSTYSNEPSVLQTAAALITGVAFPTTSSGSIPNPYETQSLYMEVTPMVDVYTYSDASQVISAGLTNVATTQNAFLSPAQMSNMQAAYKQGTKVFILRDSARCYIIPVTTLNQSETIAISQAFSNCVNK